MLPSVIYTLQSDEHTIPIIHVLISTKWMYPGVLGDEMVGALASRTRNHCDGVMRPGRAPRGDLEREIPRDPSPERFRDFRDYNYQFQDSCRAQESATVVNISKNRCEFNKNMN